MRLWSIHPRFLDSQGLVALWREALLAQKVLAGKTLGYRHHPQLNRFRKTKNPIVHIGAYLRGVSDEAKQRGYLFDSTKIIYQNRAQKKPRQLTVTRGQLKYETSHLLLKLKRRDKLRFKKFAHRKVLKPHDLFRVVAGSIEDWERIKRK